MDAQDISFKNSTFDMVFISCVFCSISDLLMDFFNPHTVNLYGANINRRTVENLKKAGFQRIEVKNLAGDIVKKIVISNEK